ncbi:hypothetical protein BDZ88DRAFT_223867 [Geranomyces variabilis]|nr:hypothetical protein BDZ88DRAFT_223867 [Geranomyces variabilis]
MSLLFRCVRLQHSAIGGHGTAAYLTPASLIGIFMACATSCKMQMSLAGGSVTWDLGFVAVFFLIRTTQIKDSKPQRRNRAVGGNSQNPCVPGLPRLDRSQFCEAMEREPRRVLLWSCDMFAGGRKAPRQTKKRQKQGNREKGME